MVRSWFRFILLFVDDFVSYLMFLPQTIQKQVLRHKCIDCFLCFMYHYGLDHANLIS